jgi:hypothetical protein
MIDGKPVSEDYEIHYDSRAEAEQVIVEYSSDDDPAAFKEAVANTDRCWTLNLVCGTEWTYHGDFDSSHFDSKADLLDLMDHQKVVQLDGENQYADWECCEICDAAIERRPARPVVQVHPDQAPLFPVAGDTIPEGWTR